GNISELLQGFQREPGGSEGYDIYVVQGWDYPALVRTYMQAAEIAREEHVPAIVHVTEMTQPQGHSTSGSHERYKSPERLAWEEAFDCIKKMREWIVEQEIASEAELEEMEKEARRRLEGIRRKAWQAYQAPILQELQEVSDIVDEMLPYSQREQELEQIKRQLSRRQNPNRKDVLRAVREI